MGYILKSVCFTIILVFPFKDAITLSFKEKIVQNSTLMIFRMTGLSLSSQFNKDVHQSQYEHVVGGVKLKML
jgi:hypothetical protein